MALSGFAFSHRRTQMNDPDFDVRSILRRRCQFLLRGAFTAALALLKSTQTLMKYTFKTISDRRSTGRRSVEARFIFETDNRETLLISSYFNYRIILFFFNRNHE